MGGDITCVRTWAGFVYLATVLDCATKKVVGYAMADNMRTRLVCDATGMAVRSCPTVKGETIFHTGRGSQYTSEQFSAHLNRYGIRASVGRTGVCWDNAWVESFNATLKNERVHRMVYPTREKAMNDIGLIPFEGVGGVWVLWSLVVSGSGFGGGWFVWCRWLLVGVVGAWVVGVGGVGVWLEGAVVPGRGRSVAVVGWGRVVPAQWGLLGGGGHGRRPDRPGPGRGCGCRGGRGCGWAWPL
ncbi:DDE-type integrase/transposase/recombinase [Actinomyces respiraculi]|uniref:DDE-type integrase/transposase/recombinase n=2 Tax=Actinomyces TaxID=1654 RepID=A0A7T0LJY2_9ACTO|nr:DDE-type integrase/transposase/recombinase [Actinomyces respiraculi]